MKLFANLSVSSSKNKENFVGPKSIQEEDVIEKLSNALHFPQQPFQMQNLVCLEISILIGEPLPWPHPPP